MRAMKHITGLAAACLLAGSAAASTPELTAIGYVDGGAEIAAIGYVANDAVAAKPTNDHGDDHGDGHGDDHGDGHGDDHGDGHGDGAHHGPHFTGDADGDGTANWMDADADEDVGDGTYVLPAIGAHAFNFVLFLALLYFGFGGVIRDAVRNRAVRIRAELDEAQELRTEAVAHHDAIAARLDGLAAEIAEMETRAKADAEAEAERIKERAAAGAASVAETAKRQIADEAARASQALKAEAVELAVQLAEGILTKQLADADQTRLAEQFLASVDAEGPHA